LTRSHSMNARTPLPSMHIVNRKKYAAKMKMKIFLFSAEKYSAVECMTGSSIKETRIAQNNVS